MNIYNNGKMYFFFSFFSIVENSKKIKNNICGESKSSYKEREEKGRTHINCTFFYILKNKNIYFYNIYIFLITYTRFEYN